VSIILNDALKAFRIMFEAPNLSLCQKCCRNNILYWTIKGAIDEESRYSLLTSFLNPSSCPYLSGMSQQIGDLYFLANLHNGFE